MTTKTPECRCLHCGHPLTATTGVNHNERPGPGDVVICWTCGAIMKFANDLTVRGMTDQEAKDLLADPEYSRYLAKIVRRIKTQPKWN